MPTDPMETPEIIAVADGFFVRQAIDNIAWIDMGEYALVVDALEQPELEDEIFSAIQSTLGEKPVRYLLNTHTHYDHVALNRAFQERFNTEIVNQQNTPLPPDGRWFKGSRRSALILPMPGCHTDEDCIVHLPDDSALFVGDIFGYGLIPLSVNLCAETAKLLLDTHARLIDFDASVVIPGHGPLCTTGELKRWVEYFNWIQKQVAQACANGKTDAQIMQDIAPPDDMQTWWRFTLWKHEDTLAKILKATRMNWQG